MIEAKVQVAASLPAAELAHPGFLFNFSTLVRISFDSYQRSGPTCP